MMARATWVSARSRSAGTERPVAVWVSVCPGFVRFEVVAIVLSHLAGGVRCPGP